MAANFETTGADPPDPPVEETAPKSKGRKKSPNTKKASTSKDDQSVIDNMAKRLEEADGGSS